MANGLALFEALADGVERDLAQTLAPQLSLAMRITPAAETRALHPPQLLSAQ